MTLDYSTSSPGVPSAPTTLAEIPLLVPTTATHVMQLQTMEDAVRNTATVETPLIIVILAVKLNSEFALPPQHSHHPKVLCVVLQMEMPSAPVGYVALSMGIVETRQITALTAVNRLLEIARLGQPRLLLVGLAVQTLVVQPVRTTNAALCPITYTDDIYDCVEDSAVALSYDDSPYEYTSQLLDILKSYGFQATFFITGNNNGK
ncbi:hypothetical protein G7Y89_g818 [Cudoniella acicularis]|uniref:NodB homology domain-containing protein n=1 Tax=Cudoniella acicularis TaxID=354080 RepID=A0A8H4RZA1_9HELO|nr:hypothetical protein G7Y89_g818 [Cudoniella acicularis]